MAEFEDRQFYQYPPFNPIIPAPVWGKDAEYAVPVVSSVGNGPAGPKGEDGGYIPFDELTDEQLEKIYMGASACHTYSTDAYVLTTGTQTQRITIPIEDISEYDLLCVDVEGLDLVEGTDYTFMDDYIVLNSPITHPNTRVHFKAISYQLADGDRNMNVTRIVNEVKPMFANPVEYAGTSTYPAMTIVKYEGAYYVSKKAVPIWTAPDNTEFWQLTFLYEDIMAVGAGGTGAGNAADARENLGITPANIGAATQGDMDDAEAAIGDVDVEEDGSLQEQITAIKNNVGPYRWWPDGTIAVNGSFQIPSQVFDHGFIFIQARRFGYSSSVILETGFIKTDGVSIRLETAEGRYWEFHIEAVTFACTLTSKGSSTGDPYISIAGIF